MQLDEMLVEFGRQIKGRVIRNQKVEYVELLMDNFAKDDGKVRYLLMVVFEEANRHFSVDVNQYLERLFSEMPGGAFAITEDRDQLERWATMQEEPEWILEDEIDLRAIDDEESE